MTGLAARSMGYDVHVLDPTATARRAAVASRVVTARFDDADAAADLARGCAVLTLEIEQIAPTALEAWRAHAPVRPGRGDLGGPGPRAAEGLAAEHAFPVGRSARRARGRRRGGGARAGREHRQGGARRLRRPRAGARADGAGAARRGRRSGARRSVVEQRLDLALEFSVLVARAPGGQMAVYPPAQNHHARGVLTWSVTPAPLDARWRATAPRSRSASPRGSGSWGCSPWSCS
jgi:5-(carboxyamino)imidazole ribonucleotide synthase